MVPDVVDTNVPLVVRFPDDHPRELVEACEELLSAIIEGGSIVTDQDGEIVEEYFHQLGRGGQPTLGSVFAKWVFDQRWTLPHRVVDLKPTGGHRYATLPDDDGEFDPSDRKFVAAAKLAEAPVHQATDTKWLDWGDALRTHGVTVAFVHEPSIRDAYRRKFGRDAP